MKKIVQFECEICKHKYESEKEAVDCEALGKFNGSKYPAGLMFEYHHHDFVGIFSFPAKPKANDYGHKGGHIGESAWWACRTEKYKGDTLGKDLCGHSYLYSDEKGFNEWKDLNIVTKEKVKCPEFKRMVAYLKSKNITPSYYNEKGELIKL